MICKTIMVAFCIFAGQLIADADIVLMLESSEIDRAVGGTTSVDLLISSTTGDDELRSFTLFLDDPGPGIELKTGIDFASDIPWNFRKVTAVSGTRTVATDEVVDRFMAGASAPGYRIGAASFGTSHPITTTGDQKLASLQFDIAPETSLGSIPLDFTFVDASGNSSFSKSNFELPSLGSLRMNITQVPEPSAFLFLSIGTVAYGVVMRLRRTGGVNVRLISRWLKC